LFAPGVTVVFFVESDVTFENVCEAAGGVMTVVIGEKKMCQFGRGSVVSVWGCILHPDWVF
jgi:hypothetical protein